MKPEMYASYQKRTSKVKKVSGWAGLVLILVSGSLPILEHFTGVQSDTKVVIFIGISGLLLVGAPVKDLIMAWKES